MANDMRSKIAANEYKDFILWFMFYKFLSDKELRFLKEQEYTDDEIKNLSKEDIHYVKEHIWYFIEYTNLFSYWIELWVDFDISNVRDAISAFNDNFDSNIWNDINQNHKKVFEKIFDPLQTWLSKLWDSATSQTKAVSKIINLIKTIPMENEADYDVLWFIYEYLISNFAANAGKKAWEFYTPHEVSKLMSEIVAHHLSNRDSIKIYDPTSWSGSLLINIWKSIAKHMKNPNSIEYYAQELKPDTYSLTRMNLVMRWISSHNIHTRNADTLEEDRPMDEEWMKDPLRLDAVVSNPPYSQKWDPSDKAWDPRYVEYWLAPKGKADYAFLLHDLYHIKPDGIMTIVLPHGTLFRWWEEYEIRKNLVENNRIDTIIWLPANIFFWTWIPTIIMVLKKQKADDKIQIIDASKYFEKWKKNKLRDCDIKRILDSILKRNSIPKFSKLVTKDEIIDNDYNLNIPRYIDSYESPEKWDIYAIMHWWIPKDELNEFDNYFNIFPNLKNDLFKQVNEKYYECLSKDVQSLIQSHDDVVSYRKKFFESFSSYEPFLKSELIDDIENIWKNTISKKETILWNKLFDLLEPIELIDNYDAFQILADSRKKISWHLEIIQNEWIDACKKVDPNMIWKKDDKELVEVQDWVKWRIIDFEIVKVVKLKTESEALEKKKMELDSILSKYDEIYNSLTEDDIDSLWDAVNDEDSKFINKEIIKLAKEIEKDWDEISEDSREYKVIEVGKLINKEKKLKKEIKEDEAKLIEKIIQIIENLSIEWIKELLYQQWIMPIISWVNKKFEDNINWFCREIDMLSKKYDVTLSNLKEQINEKWEILSEIVNDLEWNDFDMKWLEEFKSLLKN